MQVGVKNFKWSRKRFIALSVVALVIISLVTGVFLYSKNSSASSTAAAEKRTTRVVRGKIEVALSGSGTVKSSNTSDVMTNVQGKITKAYFKEGDKIKTGDLLFEIDDTDAKLNIQKIENQISQALLNVDSNQKSFSNLTVTAPFDGLVTGISAKTGESTGNNMALFTITETSRLNLSIPFSEASIQNIKIGQKANVHVQEVMDTVEGIVTAIDDYTYTASDGGRVRNVEVTVNNPGRLTDTMTASVDIITSKGIESGNGVSPLEYANKQSVKAAANGTFAEVNVKENQYVKKGDVLIQIDNDDLKITAQTNDLKVKDLQNQLEAAKKQLENYKIYSSISGTVTGETAVAGDSVKSGDILISIRDFDKMQFTISVDELDISKVKVGQSVAITIDALDETSKTPLTGEVIYKAMEGTSTNGVATYDVKIKINETENLLAGMNANASIILNQADNILMVPLEAITKMGDRSFVRVLGTDEQSQSGTGSTDRRPGNWGGKMSAPPDSNRTGNTSKNDSPASGSSDSQKNSPSGTSSARRQMSAAFGANQEYYKGTVMKEVELGINNDEYAEIKSGLSEGDIVVLPPLVTNSTSGSSNSQGGFGLGLGGGMGGGFGGGMPSGGFPGGSGQNNRNSGNSNRQTNTQGQR